MSESQTDATINVLPSSDAVAHAATGCNTEPGSFVAAPNLRDDDFYNMSFHKRGLALIFNNEKFGIPGVPDRPETKFDLEALKVALSELDFELDVNNDKCVGEIEDKIQEVASCVDHSNHDCLLVVIMTHGVRNGVLTAYDGEYKFENIWKHFTADKCKTLAGKPKIFITQACQGENSQNAIEMRPAEHDSAIINYNIPTHADFLLAHSTIPDYFSFRRVFYGSWYIQTLCQELKSKGKTIDFVSLLTIVSRRVATEFEAVAPHALIYHERKQIPCFVSLLTRLIKFTDKPSILQ